MNAMLIEALKKIASMTDIEADFDGFEARQIAKEALRSIAPYGPMCMDPGVCAGTGRCHRDPNCAD